MANAHDVSLSDRIFMTLEATREVATPLVSGVIIIVTVFLPLLSLEGLEGRLFAPVALTIAFALGSALVLSLTVVPALSATLLKPGHADEPWLVRKIAAIYEPLAPARARQAVDGRRHRLSSASSSPALAYSRIGQTFMPVMDEGTPVITIRKHPTISVKDSRRDRHAHSARNHESGARSQGHDGARRRRRTRHRSRRTQRYRQLPLTRAAKRMARQGHGLVDGRNPRGARHHARHFLRLFAADRHARAGDDHRRARRRRCQNLW